MLTTALWKLALDVAEIEIIPTGMSRAASQGVNVHISSIVRNNNYSYDLNELKPDGWYGIWDTEIENYGDSSKPLILRPHRYDSFQINFFQNPYMGYVDIKTAEETYHLDLYTESIGTLTVDIPFAVARSSSWIESVAAGCLTAAAATSILYLLVHLRSFKIATVISAVTGVAAALFLMVTHIDFGRQLNLCFLVSYGALAGFVLPDLFQHRHTLPLNSKTFNIAIIILSCTAAVASLYTSVIRPYSSFHFGIYCVIQFADIMVYWIFFFYTCLGATKKLLDSSNKIELML